MGSVHHYPTRGSGQIGSHWTATRREPELVAVIRRSKSSPFAWRGTGTRPGFSVDFSLALLTVLATPLLDGVKIEHWELRTGTVPQ